MKKLFALICLFVVNLFSVAYADLVVNTSIRYKETPHNAVMFEVSNEHARNVIEPQISKNFTLDQYQNKAVMIQLTDYVVDHTQYALFCYYGLESDDIEIGKTRIGSPSTLPEGMIFVTEVTVKSGMFRKKLNVGFVIPSVKGFEGSDIVYFIYQK